jgi:Zn-finger nucleic acid-binding protein
MQCPNCSTQMQLMQKYDVDIDYCPSCKGVWLDRGEIDKIAKSKAIMKTSIITNIITEKEIMMMMTMTNIIIIDAEREDFLVTCLASIKASATVK